MAKSNNEEIERLKEMINRLEMFTQPYLKLGELFEELTNIALLAEEAQDIELLQFIFQKLMPEVDEISNTYQWFTKSEKAKKLYQKKAKLEEHARYLRTFDAHSMIHVSADTTGNAGDYILARGIRKQVEGARGDICWYHADVRQRPDSDFIRVCNRSEGVVLGGGGLFLWDTNPNEISGWQWPCSVQELNAIQAPIYVLAVGYNRFRGQTDFPECFRENVNSLVEKAAFFGLRNHGSIEAIRRYLREDLREKVVYHPCPTTVLSKLYELPERGKEEPFIALNCAFDRSEMRYGDQEEAVMFAIARVVKRLSQHCKIKYYAHTNDDERMFPYLNAVGVEYEKVALARQMSEQEYLSYFTEPELVLAIRGHAQMIPFGCKTPTVSIISHDKLKWFLDDIGHPEWGVEAMDEHLEEKLLEKSLYMLAHRKEICAQIEAAQEELWRISQENLRWFPLA